MSQGDVFNYFNLIKNEKENQFLLKKAKFNILNGDLKLQILLKTISSKNKTIHFPKKDFKPSFFFLKKILQISKILDDPEFSFFSSIRKFAS